MVKVSRALRTKSNNLWMQTKLLRINFRLLTIKTKLLKIKFRLLTIKIKLSRIVIKLSTTISNARRITTNNSKIIMIDCKTKIRIRKKSSKTLIIKTTILRKIIAKRTT